jgi:hypothetical protein
MRKLVDAVRIIKKQFVDRNHIIKNCEDKPFFGEVIVIINDGKIVRIKGIEESINI